MAKRVLPWDTSKKETPKPRKPREPTGPRYEGLVWAGPIEDGFREVRLKKNHHQYTYVALKNLVRSLGLRGFSKYTETRTLYPELKQWLVDQEKYYIVKEGKPHRLPNKADLVGNVRYKGYGLLHRPATPSEIEETVGDIVFEDPVAEEEAKEQAIRDARPRVSFEERVKRRRQQRALFGPRRGKMPGRKPLTRKPVVKDAEGWIDTKAREASPKAASPKAASPKAKATSPKKPAGLAWVMSQSLDMGGDLSLSPKPRSPSPKPSPKVKKARSPSPEPEPMSPSPKAKKPRSPSPEPSPKPRSPSPSPEAEPRAAKRKRGRSRSHHKKRSGSPERSRSRSPERSREERRRRKREKHGKRRKERRKRARSESRSRSESPATPRMRRPGKDSITLDPFTIEMFRHELGRVHGSERRRLRDLKALIEEHILVVHE